jgi:hypothetical protein
MNDLRASNALRALIETAKSDGPNAATRADVWSSVCCAVAPPSAPGSTKATLSSAGSGKAVSIGALFGGTVTVGLAAAVLILQPMRSVGQSPSGKQAAPTASARVVIAVPSQDIRPMRAEAPVELRPAVSTRHDSAAEVEPALDSTHGNAGAFARAPTSPAGALPPSRPSSRPPSSGLASADDAFDPLAREASLLTQARAALGRGDAQAALRSVRAAMAVPGRQLVPEELSVESQALRALGRPRDADALTTELRARYPDSALAR